MMKEQLLSTLKNSKEYTLAVAQAMPESKYSFSPAPGVWSFGALMNHIAYGIEWWESNFIKKEEAAWNPPSVSESKGDVLKNLEHQFQHLESTIKQVQEIDELITGFHATLDHITHHRGQATTYLRCQGITPPEYTF